MKKWTKKYFINLKEGSSVKDLTSDLFQKIQENFANKNQTYKFAYNQRSSTPQSINFSNKSNNIITNPLITTPTSNPIIKSKHKNVKSLDFFLSKKKIPDFQNPQFSESKPQKTQNLKKGHFLSSFLDIKDKNSLLIDILDNHDDDLKILKAIELNSFQKFTLSINNKIQKINNIYNENFKNKENYQNTLVFFDLLRLINNQLFKIVDYYDSFLHRKSGENLNLKGLNAINNQNSNEVSDFISGIDNLVRIYSPFNLENQIKINEINEIYQTQYKIIYNKFLYETENPIYRETLSKIESQFKSYESILESILVKNKTNESELLILENFLNNNMFLPKTETKTIFDKHFSDIQNANEINAIKNNNYLGLIDSYNEIFIKNMKKLEFENEDLNKQLNNIRNGSIVEDKPLISRKNKPRKLKTHDKEVQINFNEFNFQAKVSQNSYSLQNIIKKSIVYYKYKEHDIISLISLILNDKMISDYHEIKENKRILPLDLYLPKWFLHQLGNPDISNLILRDFILNMRDNLTKNNRIYLFLSLCGINTEISHDDLIFDPNSFMNEKTSENSTKKRKFKQIFLASSYSCKILLKTAFLLRYSSIDEDPYQPLLPNPDTESDKPRYKILQGVLKEILIDEMVEIEIIDEVLKNFLKFCTNNRIVNIIPQNIGVNTRVSVSMAASQRRGTNIPTIDVVTLKFDLFVSSFWSFSLRNSSGKWNICLFY